MDGRPLELTEIFPDVCCKREILQLVCFCKNKKFGCVWKGELRDLEVGILGVAFDSISVSLQETPTIIYFVTGLERINEYSAMLCRILKTHGELNRSS